MRPPTTFHGGESGLLDTSVLIGRECRRARATGPPPGTIPVSVVTLAELRAALRTTLRRVGRRMPVNDSWIAATALAHGLPVVAQDDDDGGVPGLTVIRV